MLFGACWVFFFGLRDLRFWSAFFWVCFWVCWVLDLGLSVFFFRHALPLAGDLSFGAVWLLGLSVFFLRQALPLQLLQDPPLHPLALPLLLAVGPPIGSAVSQVMFPPSPSLHAPAAGLLPLSRELTTASASSEFWG